MKNEENVRNANTIQIEMYVVKNAFWYSENFKTKTKATKLFSNYIMEELSFFCKRNWFFESERGNSIQFPLLFILKLKCMDGNSYSLFLDWRSQKINNIL